MNGFEEQVKSFLIKNQWKIIHRGWPDFLCIRETPHGPSCMAIEAKNIKDDLSEDQKIVHMILKKAGLAVYTIRPEHLNGQKSTNHMWGKFIWNTKSHNKFKSSIKYIHEKLDSQNKENADLKKEIEDLKNELDRYTILFDDSEEKCL